MDDALYDDYLMHYGVLGMKWGHRKSTNASNKNSHNKNYTDKQRKNDRAFYGQRGEKRINKKLNEGYGLRGARHFLWVPMARQYITMRKRKACLEARLQPQQS